MRNIVWVSNPWTLLALGQLQDLLNDDDDAIVVHCTGCVQGASASIKNLCCRVGGAED